MDELSKALSDLRADTVVPGRFLLSAPWSFTKPAGPEVPFRMCTRNPFYLIVEGAKPVFIRPGDFVLLPRGSEHVLCSSPDVPPIPMAQLMSNAGAHPQLNTPLTFTAGGNGPVTEMYTAIIGFREAKRNPFLSVLPPVIHIHADDPAVPAWLTATMQAFIQESMNCDLGWAIAAARLADVLVVHLLRAYIAHAKEHDFGWLRAMHDVHLVKALALIHRDPSKAWTVDDLAAEAGMSRSRFSARFLELVGETPIAHLTSYRMFLAAGKLMHGHANLAEVAQSVGYASDKAFTRAFRRWSGMPPKAYGRSTPDIRVI
ncbi:AraC family transcriptional regulator [Paraburkholderia terrae]|uniref:AraC family transcriptional regulator n=1 Tax=Paraburkholderia TaxID=1822464 RepID=UPI001EE1B23E|nr:AraC family transcriptional regulator [Paraburkholderia terrae]BEU21179.1 AraC family transcriptional regulator [Paraburkholderia sp. 22B1P]GJH07076.1 AraC family transcriptional regulator [Paraburkholderia terrae]GJH39411.1 AraC family transcriptional regulator [Paraburkholderia hospita]